MNWEKNTFYQSKFLLPILILVRLQSWGEKKQGSISKPKDFCSRSSAKHGWRISCLSGIYFWCHLWLFFTFLACWLIQRFGMLAGWDCDVFVSCTVQPLQAFVYLPGVLGASCSLSTAPGWEQRFWGTQEHLPGMAKGGWGRRGGDGYHWSLLAALSSVYFFSILLVNPFSLSHSANAGGSSPFWWSHCWHEGFRFLSSGASVCPAWKWYYWIGLMCVVPKRFWLLALRQEEKNHSALYEILTSSNKRLRCILEGWFGLSKVFAGFPPYLVVRNLLATMVWTLVLLKFCSSKDNLVGFADGA